MNMSDYLQESSRTVAEGQELNGELVPWQELQYALKCFAGWGEVLDKIKKAYAYGKPYETIVEGGPTLEFYPEPDILHAIIGICTEAGELAEAVLNAGLDAEYDEVNLKEEVGDELWYQALLLRQLKSTFEDEAKRNIDKLKARFPDKFDQGHALERNLDKEREALIA